MRLYIVRHATAVARGTVEDALRELTPEGRDEARDIARAFRRLKIEPNAIVSSPRLRCIQTAAAIGAEYGMTPSVDDHAGPGLSLAGLAEIVHDVGLETSTVIVGHEPDLSELVAALTGARVRMPKAAVAYVRATSFDDGELRALLRPIDVSAIARRTLRRGG